MPLEFKNNLNEPKGEVGPKGEISGGGAKGYVDWCYCKKCKGCESNCGSQTSEWKRRTHWKYPNQQKKHMYNNNIKQYNTKNTRMKR